MSDIDSATEWWQDSKYEIETLETSEFGVEKLYGRETLDGWEYSITSWRYHVPMPHIFKNGKIIELA